MAHCSFAAMFPGAERGAAGAAGSQAAGTLAIASRAHPTAARAVSFQPLRRQPQRWFRPQAPNARQPAKPTTCAGWACAFSRLLPHAQPAGFQPQLYNSWTEGWPHRGSGGQLPATPSAAAAMVSAPGTKRPPASEADHMRGMSLRFQSTFAPSSTCRLSAQQVSRTAFLGGWFCPLHLPRPI